MSVGRAQAAQFRDQGYTVLPAFVPTATIDQIVREAEDFYGRQGVETHRADRTMNLHQESPTLRELLHGQRLAASLSELLAAPPYFLQSIYFTSGSQQAAHSDYIYMSTDPPLQLCGVWIAMEDVLPDAGPLMYFPGSHSMPMPGIEGFFAESKDQVATMLERDGEALQRSYATRLAQSGESLEQCVFYDLWLNRISTYVRGVGLPMETFQARKGDVLVWHANLVHGGTAIVDQASTRKSVVAHYLTEDVEKYYDMNFFRHQAVLCLGDIDVERPAVLQVRA